MISSCPVPSVPSVQPSRPVPSGQPIATRFKQNLTIQHDASRCLHLCFPVSQLDQVFRGCSSLLGSIYMGVAAFTRGLAFQEGSRGFQEASEDISVWESFPKRCKKRFGGFWGAILEAILGPKSLKRGFQKRAEK